MRADFEQRLQHEPAPVRLGMGEQEPSRHAMPARAADDATAGVDEIEVERPGAATARRAATGGTLQPFEERQRPGRRVRAVGENDSVAKPRLARRADRRGCINSRCSPDANAGLAEVPERGPHRRNRITPGA